MFALRVEPNEKGEKVENGRVAAHESAPFHLNHSLLISVMTVSLSGGSV